MFHFCYPSNMIYGHWSMHYNIQQYFHNVFIGFSSSHVAEGLLFLYNILPGMKQKFTNKFYSLHQQIPVC